MATFVAVATNFAVGIATGTQGTVTAATVASTAATAATVASVAGAGLSVASSLAAGQAAKDDAKFRSRIAGIEAQGRELERRRRLIVSLSTLTSRQGARGIQPGGTPQISLQDSIRQSELDKSTISANLATTRSLLSARGTNAQLIGRANAGATILSSLESVSRRG